MSHLVKTPSVLAPSMSTSSAKAKIFWLLVNWLASMTALYYDQWGFIETSTRTYTMIVLFSAIKDTTRFSISTIGAVP